MTSLDQLLDRVRAEAAEFAAVRAAIDPSARDARDQIAALKIAWLSRKDGRVTALMGAMGTLPTADRRAFGREVNQLKTEVEAALAELDAQVGPAPPRDAVDITLPGRRPPLGFRHPLSLVRDRVADVFTRLGYQVLEGPELEDEYHNFEALNMPAHHPARDMQDTLYLATPVHVRAVPGEDANGSIRQSPRPLTLLRTHTSAMQIRYMERHAPPVRLVAIGPVYRRDTLDLTHTPMFHQVEGLVVGPRVTLADLKGTLTAMAQQLFGDKTPVRLRPSFFPYTEPSAELDIGCFRCGGAGCAMCKGTGWIEVLGSGMVHPIVFEHVGYDPAKVTGFAFGMGIERVALRVWGVDDIRLFYENDLRFLEQFGR